MIEASEKSTGCRAEIGDGIRLDGRLAIHHERGDWLAVADLHYGYETSRRVAGGLWPDWGRQAVVDRLHGLIGDYRPETLILAGDVVDSGFIGEDGVDFLRGLMEKVPNCVLVAGNHDRGAVRREFDWVEEYETDGFVFHHGHRPFQEREAKIEVVGHHHPSVNLGDGAGLVLRLPSLVQERFSGRRQRWVLPAFSPWAGGGRFREDEAAESVSRWVCGKNRVFEI